MDEQVKELEKGFGPGARQVLKEILEKLPPGEEATPEVLLTGVQVKRLRILKRLNQIRQEVSDSVLKLEIDLLEVRADWIKFQLQKEYKIISEGQCKKLLAVARTIHAHLAIKYRELSQIKKDVENKIFYLSEKLNN